ncbi:MAG: polyphosphate kinase 2, partial [Pseudorhodoplanes sp.]
MNELSPDNAKAMHDRVREEMLDSYDEEMELELDEDRLDQMADEVAGEPLTSSVDRRTYFKELFRLQGELVKLQSWVQHEKLKV